MLSASNRLAPGSMCPTSFPRYWEHQQNRNSAISLTDFDAVMSNYIVSMQLPSWLRAPAEQLVDGLKDLKLLCVVGGNYGTRLMLSESADPDKDR